MSSIQSSISTTSLDSIASADSHCPCCGGTCVPERGCERNELETLDEVWVFQREAVRRVLLNQFLSRSFVFLLVCVALLRCLSVVDYGVSPKHFFILPGIQVMESYEILAEFPIALN
jgi:hypothetical protein